MPGYWNVPATGQSERREPAYQQPQTYDEREAAASVREKARQPVVQKSRQPGLAASTPAKTIAPTLKADILEKEFKTASDDRKEQIVDELKNTRSELNRLNKEQAILDLRKAAAGPGAPGLVARTSDGTIIIDSSGNPIMTTKGSEAFQQGRQGFRDEAGRLLQESPELYRQMYPVSHGLQKGLPALMQFMPGMGALRTLGRSALGRARDAGSGFSEWLRSFGLTPTSSINANIQGEQPSDTGGVIDAAQSVVDAGETPFYDTMDRWGTRIGLPPGTPVTGDFIDSDGDGVDDRMQTGPGQPYQGPAQGNKIADAWNQSFQVAQPLNTGIQTALTNTGNPFNIQIGGGPRPDLSGFYQGLGSFV